MNRSEIFSLVICLLFGSGSISTSWNSSVEVSRRINISDLSPDRDVFSNPSCNSSVCIPDSTCFAGNCCACQCSYGKPNYLVKNHECKSNVETKQITNADCAFSIRPENEPLQVLLVTEKDSGKVKFTSTSVRVNCFSDVVINEWYYLNAHDQWVRGEGDVFFMSHQIDDVKSWEKKDLTYFRWHTKLNIKYAGLLIRLSVYCKDIHHIGCLLAKINGTFTFDRTSPPLTTSEPPTNQQSSEQSLTPYIAGLAGVVGLICLACLVFVAYRTRKTWLSWMSKKTSQPAVAEETNEDPIYDELPEDALDFDSYPVYFDPAGPDLNRRNIQDPLPPIPGTESSYQPLSGLTRTYAPELVTSALPPPNSSPMATDNEAYDDDNPPPIGNPPANGSADYDNPPPIDNPPANISSGYENPPSIDNRPVNESSDDNPPLSSTNIDISINKPSDYDNPQQTASSVDHTPPTVDFVLPGTPSPTKNQEETVPECVVLEPEETKM